jgi:aminoglycoside 3-N-acetyltransferase
MVTREIIMRDLGALGLPRAVMVLVHSSLASLGWVDGGAETVVDAFLDHLGPAGTLVVPTLPFRGSQFDYLQSDPLFDPDTTPSFMGRVTESVRLRPGARRSWHPSHSVSAIGPAAPMLTAPQSHDPWLTFGPESPFGRLLTADGWICLLGVTHRSSTFLHAVEEQNCLDYFVWPEPLTARVLRDGEVQHIRTSVGRPGVRRAFDQIEPLLLAEHALIVGKVGAATVRLMRARAVMTIATAALRQRPHLLLAEPWGPALK